MSFNKYIEIIDLSAWDCMQNYIIPGSLLKYSFKTIENGFTQNFWPILKRINDLKVNYEPCMIYVDGNKNKISFPQDRQLLFEVIFTTIYNKRFIHSEVTIYKSFSPFEVVGKIIFIMRETYIDDKENLLAHFNVLGKPLQTEIKNLIPEKNEKMAHSIELFRKIKSKNHVWSTSVSIECKAYLHFCEFTTMMAFPNFAGILIEMGRKTLIDDIKKNKNFDYQLFKISQDTMIDWNLLIENYIPFYANDTMILNSSMMQDSDNYIFKHELLHKKPKILSACYYEVIKKCRV